MGDPQNQNKGTDKPCEICGDIGYVAVITVCSQCKITREHIYCMRVMHEGDPEKWVCEECKSVPSKHPNDVGVGFKMKKPPPNTKVRYITPEEAMTLESGATKHKSSSPSKPCMVPRPPNNKARPSNFCAKPNPHLGPFAPRKALGNKCTSSSSMDRDSSAFKEKSPKQHLCRETPTAKRLPFEKLPKPLEREDICSGHTPLQLVQCLPAIHSGTVIRTDARNNVDANESVSLEVGPELDKYLQNHPALSPTWKGSFKVSNDVVPCGSCDGIRAHPPSKVHRKVYEFSKCLPDSLQFELLPRLDLWVVMFEDDVPGALDIGLYFLPSKRVEQSYACLVEFLDRHDVLLRSYVDGIELLIFSSKHLQQDSQMINQKYYLWGLFRPSKDNTVSSNEILLAQSAYYDNKREALLLSQALNATHPCDNQLALKAERPLLLEPKVEDMDIDMLGGQEVGTIDVRVPRTVEAAEEASVGPGKREVTFEEPRDEFKSSPKREKDAILEFSPVKVKRERLWSTSCLLDEVEFEKELQWSYDRFVMMTQQ